MLVAETMTELGMSCADLQQEELKTQQKSVPGV